jgi:hypothetical protein
LTKSTSGCFDLSNFRRRLDIRRASAASSHMRGALQPRQKAYRNHLLRTL